MTQRVAIIGTGLMGGSVGLALRARGDVAVIGTDADPDNAAAAVDAGAVDAVAADLGAAVAGADLIVVATPVGQILATVRALSDVAPDGCVVTDIGSTKRTIVAEAERMLGASRPFVGGHPMAGTEGEGIASARGDLFDGALWILTPTDATDPGAYRTVHAFVSSLGARTLALDPIEHDRLVALVSHLPYAIATALMSLAAQEDDERLFQAAAGSFRDVTRTAGSNPALWKDIFATNREAVVAQLDRFVAALRTIRTAIADGRDEELDPLIAAARDARRRLPVKGERTVPDPVVVEVPIADRAGALAEVTTAVGSAGINIEDLWVDHTGSGGVLRLLVDGVPAAVRAADLLIERGFVATVVEDR